MTIALVGCAPTWKDAPYDDPTRQIWAHASCQPLRLPRVDRWFDIHLVDVWRQGKVWYRPTPQAPTYVDWLRQLTVPIVMQRHYPLVPTSVAYPLRAIVEAFQIVPAAWGLTPTDARWWEAVKNRGEFSSTFAFMVALALYEDVEALELYGVDFIGRDTLGIERSRQRPGAKYWIGLARGLGVPVTVARNSWLESQEWLYGYEPTPHEVLSHGV